MIKVFITGFRHSGTTMLMQLLRAHPQVGWIEFEESYIEFNMPKEWILMHASRKVPNMKTHVWGEKVPWGTRDTDVKAKRAIHMINRWLKVFKKEARVLNILRHPIDTALSGGRSKVGEKNWKFITTTIPKVIDFINEKPRCATVIYEDLLLDPQTHLSNIFNFLNLKTNKKIINSVMNTQLKFGKINPDRAFAHKNKQINVYFDYDELIERVKNRL